MSKTHEVTVRVTVQARTAADAIMKIRSLLEDPDIRVLQTISVDGLPLAREAIEPDEDTIPPPGA